MSFFSGLFQVQWSQYAGVLGLGLLRSLGYTAAGFIGASVLGLLLALMRLSPVKLVRLPASIYTEIFKTSRCSRSFS
jgi:ABC-type amino acid transport system permease subunit